MSGLPAKPEVWADDNPYYLIIVTNDDRIALIDLGQPGWLKTFAEFMRAPGRWHLVTKASDAVVGLMSVLDGEQPYYVARHVGIAKLSGEGDQRHETTAYGIGKKRLDGHVDRLWFLRNGAVTLGDDLEGLAIMLIKQGNL